MKAQCQRLLWPQLSKIKSPRPAETQLRTQQALTLWWAGSHTTPRVPEPWLCVLLRPHPASGGKHLTFPHGEQAGGTDEAARSTCSGVPGGPPLRKLEKENMALGKMGYGEPKGWSLFPRPSCRDRGRE